jgi:hypothetical protein
MATTYEKIASTTLGSTSATITFSSIAATYTDLRLVLTGTGSATLNVNLKYNNDSSALYSQTNLAGDGTSAESTRQTSQTFIKQMYNLFNTTPTLLTYDVFSYAGSTYKTTLITNASDDNGSGRIVNTVGLYQSATAISRVDLTASTSTFAVGTTATLYGILKA